MQEDCETGLLVRGSERTLLIMIPADISLEEVEE